MTNLKKLMMTVAMMGILIAAFTTAKAGILITDIKGIDAQTTTEAKEDKETILDLIGVIVVNLTGVIVVN
jgi:glucose uptake protein GlcU